MRVKCIAQEHDMMSLARVRAQATRSGVECTNHAATAPSSYRTVANRGKDNPAMFRRTLLWCRGGHGIESAQARSLANFYRQYADRHMNLKFVRRVSGRERAIRPFVIVKNKLMLVFNESVLLLTINFVITLSK